MGRGRGGFSNRGSLFIPGGTAHVRDPKWPDKMIEDIRKRREALAVIEAEQKARDERLELEAAKRRGVL